MLDIQECTGNEIQNHPVSRNQYPGSVNTRNGFHRDNQVLIQYFMQLQSLFRSDEPYYFQALSVVSRPLSVDP